MYIRKPYTQTYIHKYTYIYSCVSILLIGFRLVVIFLKVARGRRILLQTDKQRISCISELFSLNKSEENTVKCYAKIELSEGT